ncbi:MAG: fumarylacetoacetate hydrolase family protein [Sulfurisoma sp.]|nr:fumarylacetoacetate hydrolase family protein [Sulfurisoma sp.]
MKLVERSNKPITVRGEPVEPRSSLPGQPSTGSGRTVLLEALCRNALLVRYGPIGPWLDVNGQRVQNGSTATMIFGCREIVSDLSRFMTLLPGDVITTGTPPVGGPGMKPPRFLGAGDTVRLGVEGLGEQHQTVWAA